MKTAINLRKGPMNQASNLESGFGITRRVSRRNKPAFLMGNKMDFGSSGLWMAKKNPKENILMVSGIVSGLLGMITEIKNSRLRMIKEN